MPGVTQLWIPFVVLASLGQVLRNAMQRGLTASLGTVGATHIRFLFGFPFSLIFLAGVLAATGDSLPTPLPAFWPRLGLAAPPPICRPALVVGALDPRPVPAAHAPRRTPPPHAARFGSLSHAAHHTAGAALSLC